MTKKRPTHGTFLLDGKILQCKTVAIATVLLYDKGENDERI